jgi:UDP-4-amino-4,6-dideoxy-N-acetyl-beta-L-altrosamine transaminase|tara:strand:+ start:2502 stop:3650 length:1149 start_codon:yes stop_codon:yes gene_type:complete
MKINYSKHNISKNDIKSVIKVLKSNFLTQGPSVKFFEKKIKKIVSAKYAFAVNSATSGLHVACMSIGISKNDVVWTSPNSFVASSNCALYCGAKIDFVDIDLKNYNLCPTKLEDKLKSTKKKNLPKAIVLVHFAGYATNLERIKRLSKRYNFKIIEDSSHALGGKYKNGYIGNCQFSDVCVFSFHPVKSITTGEGGLITTNSKKISAKINLFRNHGINRDKKFLLNKTLKINHYEQIELGFNYRMSDIEAALGISQANRLTKFIHKRMSVAKFYDKELINLPIQKPIFSKDSSWHLYVILLKNNSIRKKLFEFLKKNKINCQIHYIPIHIHPYYKKIGFKKKDFPNSVEYYERCLSLPIFFDLKFSAQKKIISLMQKFFLNV